MDIISLNKHLQHWHDDVEALSNDTIRAVWEFAMELGVHGDQNRSIREATLLELMDYAHEIDVISDDELLRFLNHVEPWTVEKAQWAAIRVALGGEQGEVFQRFTEDFVSPDVLSYMHANAVVSARVHKGDRHFVGLVESLLEDHDLDPEVRERLQSLVDRRNR